MAVSSQSHRVIGGYIGADQCVTIFSHYKLDTTSQFCFVLGSDGLFRQPAPILDYTWYPSASAVNPAAYCFVASVRECPVKLIDASSGRVSEHCESRNDN